jgi:hypothetical protein
MCGELMMKYALQAALFPVWDRGRGGGGDCETGAGTCRLGTAQVLGSAYGLQTLKKHAARGSRTVCVLCMLMFAILASTLLLVPLPSLFLVGI